MDVRTDDRVLALDDPVAKHLPDPVRLAAYRVVEEALANVYRHAEASRATVELTAPNGTLEIVVRDDGRGFAPGQAPAGLGVNAIAARVGQLGGAWWLESAHGRGTALTVRLPLSAPPRRPATKGRHAAAGRPRPAPRAAPWAGRLPRPGLRPWRRRGRRWY